MELASFLSLAMVTLIVIGVIVFLGLKINQAVLQHAPGSDYSLHITFAGTVVGAGMVAFWIICVIAAKLRSESPFGSFVGSPEGMATVFFGSIFVAVVAGIILEKCGYPLATRGDQL